MRVENNGRSNRTRGRNWRLMGLGGGLVLITVLIYYSGSRQRPFITALRYLYLIPIAYVAFNYGRSPGLGLSLLITSLFVPILVTVLIDEGPTSVAVIELTITMVLFNALAAFGGSLAEREVLQKERYRTLNHLSEQFSRELDLDELARVILAETVRALNAASGELLLRDEADRLRRVAQQGSTPQVEGAATAEEPGQGLRSVAEWTLERNMLTRLEYPDVDPRFQVAGTQPPLRNLIAAPLRRSGEPFGVLILYNRRIGSFSVREAGLLEEIAIKSETSLENAQLYHTLEERVQRRTRDLAQEKNKLDVVLRSMAGALVVTDADGLIALLNPIFAQLVDRAESEILARPLSDVLPALAATGLVAQAVAQPTAVHSADVTLPSRLVYKASARALKPDGPVLGVVTVLRDVTQEVEVDRMKTDFISIVSHELRTPLTSVLGFAKLIDKSFARNVAPKIPADDRKGQRAVRRISDNLNIIVDEGERLTRLINDVLDIAKMEEGKVEWHMADTALGEVVRSATAATSALADAKHLPLITDVQPDLPPVWADRDRLVQVVTNLLSNAIKFTDEGEIRVRARPVEMPGDEQGLAPGQWLAVSVQDSGIGIAREHWPHVFERFKQVGDTTTDRPKGTGLGLPICKEIVEHHGGRIWMESQLGEGSTFTFVLPLAPARAALPTAPQEQPPPPDERGEWLHLIRRRVSERLPATEQGAGRILVVDDEANIRNLLRQELSEAGYEVLEAANGVAALEQARQTHPDLIILDVMMPGISGFDVASALRGDPVTANIPILILSIIEDRERGARLGVDGYLTKPLDTQRLLQSIASTLARANKVLTIDADTAVSAKIARVLRARGYQVLEAHDGHEGLQKARQERPDLIIVDAGISQANDYEVLRALQSAPETRDARVIALTAKATPQEVIELVEQYQEG